MRTWWTRAQCLIPAAVAALASVAPAQDALEGGPNLLRNGHFDRDTDEDGWPDGWTKYGAGTFEVVSDGAGGQAVRIEDASAEEGTGLVGAPLPAASGSRYVATARARLQRGAAHLYIEFHDQERKRLATITAPFHPPAEAADGWATAEVAALSPPRTASVSVLLYCSKRNVGAAVFDDVSLTERAIDTGRIRLRAEGRPRVLLTADDLARIRQSAFDASAYLDESALTVTYFGAATRRFPLPPEEPGKPPPEAREDRRSYPYWTGLARALQDRLQGLALGFLATGDQRYANRAKEYALALAGWQRWTDPAQDRTALSAAHLALGVAFVYDTLYDQFLPEERERIRDALLRNCLAVLAPKACDLVDSHSAAVRNAGLGLAALAVLDEQNEAPVYVAVARDYLEWYLEHRATSGDTEGLGHTAYAVDHALLFAEALHRVTRDDRLLHKPYPRAVAPHWATYFLLPGRHSSVNFGDDSGAVAWFVTMNAVARTAKNALAAWFAEATGQAKGSGFHQALLPAPDVQPDGPERLPPSRAFERIGWAALRSGWGEQDTLLAFISSPSKLQHGHFDANHFILAVGGETVICDPGYRDPQPGPTRDFTVGSVGHNTLLVDGQGQTRLGGGRVTRFWTSPSVDYVEGQAADAYDEGLLTRFRRRVVQVRPDYFLVHDEIEASEPHAWASLLHAGREGAIRVDGAEPQPDTPQSATRLDFRQPQARAMVQLLRPEGATVRITRLQGAEQYGPYAVIEPQEKSTREQFTFLVRPQRFDEDEPPDLPEWEVTRVQADPEPVRAFEISRGDRRDVIVFAPDKYSSTLPDLSTDAPLSWLFQAGGQFREAGCCDGRRLSAAGESLFEASAPVHAAVQRIADGWWLRLRAEGRTEVRLPAGRDIEVTGSAEPGMREGDRAVVIVQGGEATIIVTGSEEAEDTSPDE